MIVPEDLKILPEWIVYSVMPRGRKKQPAGTQRTYQVLVRFKPESRDAIEAKMELMRIEEGKERWTVADLVRYAAWEFCKPPGDPRQA